MHTVGPTRVVEINLSKSSEPITIGHVNHFLEITVAAALVACMYSLYSNINNYFSPIITGSSNGGLSLIMVNRMHMHAPAPRLARTGMCSMGQKWCSHGAVGQAEYHIL